MDGHDIDWQALGLPNAPQLLAAILSEDPDVRQTAYYNLYDLGLHDIPPAAPYVVPILIDDMRYQVPDPAAILDLLGGLADSASAIGAIQPCADCAAVLDAMGQGIDLYLSFLTGEPDAAKYASIVLSFLAPHAERIVAAYLDIFGQVAPETQADILMSIFRLMTNSDTDPAIRQMLDVDCLTALFDRPAHAKIQHGAALVLAELMGQALPERVENWLVKDAIYKANSTTGYIDPNRDALRALGVERTSAAFIRVIAAITKPYLIASTLDQLLDLVFDDQSPMPREVIFKKDGKEVIGVLFRSADTPYAAKLKSSLSAFQLDILSQLAELERIWSVENNILELHGLPNTQPELRAFLNS